MTPCPNRSPQGTTHMRIPALFLTLLALLGAATSCTAPRTETTESGDPILRGIACPKCTIVAESVAFIPHPDDTVAIRGEITPTVDSRGRFYIAAKSGAAILAFGPNGRLISAIGKAGNGPGEFARVEDIQAG